MLERRRLYLLQLNEIISRLSLALTFSDRWLNFSLEASTSYGSSEKKLNFNFNLDSL